MAHNKTEVRKILDTVKASGRASLTAPEGKLVCDAYGIPVPKEGVATSAAEASKLAAGMGFPVVLKIVSPEILHKTEAGGVIVGMKTAEEVEKGFATIMANARKYDAKANLLGVQVQQMLGGGQEVIIGGRYVVDDASVPREPEEVRSPGHCFVDYRGLTRQERKDLRAHLYMCATARGEIPTRDTLPDGQLSIED